MKGRVLSLGTVAAVASILFLTPLVQAQTYPSQPIQLIVPMAPGDTVDLAGDQQRPGEQERGLLLLDDLIRWHQAFKQFVD